MSNSGPPEVTRRSSDTSETSTVVLNEEQASFDRAANNICTVLALVLVVN